jgi:hypothetical protein
VRLHLRIPETFTLDQPLLIERKSMTSRNEVGIKDFLFLNSFSFFLFLFILIKSLLHLSIE